VHLNVVLKRPSQTVTRLLKRVTVLFWVICAVAIAPVSFAQKWKELKPEEQKALAPLARDWDQFSDVRKKKWREVAGKQATMTPEQQQNLQNRMQGWSQMSPEERKKAREGYQELKQLPPEKRAAVPQKWDEYRNLPPEKQEELRKKAATPRTDKGKAASPTPAAEPPRQ
jgi:Protein of unknown function (DUF3106)